MKLKNKKTGEIVELFGISCKGLRTFLQFKDNRGNFKFECNSLAELDVEWEDYEEPKEYWFIDEYGMVQQEIDYHYDENKSAVHDKRLEVGNYFETKEEVELAVRKLKAWKRLKDKGFHFLGWNSTYKGDNADFYIVWMDSDSKDEIVKDLDILFGGEE